MWSEVCFPLAGSICFRWQPRGVLPTSTPAVVTFLPPRNVSSAAWRQSKNPSRSLFTRVRLVPAKLLLCFRFEPRHLSPQAATYTCMEVPRAPAVQAARCSTSAGSQLRKCPRYSGSPAATHAHTHFAQLIPIIAVDSKDYYGLTDLHDRLWGAF